MPRKKETNDICDARGLARNLLGFSHEPTASVLRNLAGKPEKLLDPFISEKKLRGSMQQNATKYAWSPEFKCLLENVLYLYAIGFKPEKISEILGHKDTTPKEISDKIEANVPYVEKQLKLQEHFLSHKNRLKELLNEKGVDYSKIRLWESDIRPEDTQVNEKSFGIDPVEAYLIKHIEDLKTGNHAIKGEPAIEAEKALLLIRTGLHKEAEQILQLSLQKFPENSRLHYANALNWLKLYRDAKSAGTQAYFMYTEASFDEESYSEEQLFDALDSMNSFRNKALAAFLRAFKYWPQLSFSNSSKAYPEDFPRFISLVYTIIGIAGESDLYKFRSSPIKDALLEVCRYALENFDHLKGLTRDSMPLTETFCRIYHVLFPENFPVVFEIWKKQIRGYYYVSALPQLHTRLHEMTLHRSEPSSTMFRDFLRYRMKEEEALSLLENLKEDALANVARIFDEAIEGYKNPISDDDYYADFD